MLILGSSRTMQGQELQPQAAPLSIYLDLRPALTGAEPQTTPAWIEAFEFIPASTTKATSGVEAVAPGVSGMLSIQAAATLRNNPADTVAATPRERPSAGMLSMLATVSDDAKAVFRIRLQRPVGATNHLQARVFFDDSSRGTRPRLSVWNELGAQLMQSAPLGQGIGLPSSETLLIPMDGVDYLEIETTGDGSHVRGIFLTWLTPTKVLQPKDFPSDELVREPFGTLNATRAPRDDAYLYGVVTAGLQDDKPVLLKRGRTPGTTFQFELEQRPLLAIVTYEVLGATIGAPPTVTVNDLPQGESDLHLPDLADPGFRGESAEGRPRMTFRYTGWLRAQKVIPGEALVAGLNNLSLELSNSSKAIAVRSVSIQLKYNWEKLDYILSPAHVSHESP